MLTDTPISTPAAEITGSAASDTAAMRPRIRLRPRLAILQVLLLIDTEPRLNPRLSPAPDSGHAVPRYSVQLVLRTSKLRAVRAPQLTFPGASRPENLVPC